METKEIIAFSTFIVVVLSFIFMALSDKISKALIRHREASK